MHVGEQVANILQPDRQADRVRLDSLRGLLLRRQALVRGGGGMGRQRFRIAEVVGGEHQLQRVEEGEGGFLAG